MPPAARGRGVRVRRGHADLGSCVSAHFYRLGEGALASPFALLGAGAGFVLGFASWNTLYLAMIQQAPVVWLPHHLGYGGTVLLQGAASGLLALGLSRLGHRGREPASRLLVCARDASGQGPDSTRVDTFAGDVSPPVTTDPPPWRAVLQDRWSPAVGGLLVANAFRPRLPTGREIVRNCTGGVLMGWGGMTALGCAVGTLLSGVMAGAASGWIFGVACVTGIWVALRLRPTR